MTFHVLHHIQTPQTPTPALYVTCPLLQVKVFKCFVMIKWKSTKIIKYKDSRNLGFEIMSNNAYFFLFFISYECDIFYDDYMDIS